jgi:hypothetical protein
MNISKELLLLQHQSLWLSYSKDTECKHPIPSCLVVVESLWDAHEN